MEPTLVRRVAAAVAALLAVLLVPVGAAPAAAHQSSAQIVTVIDSISPELPEGVSVRVLAGVATQLAVENDTDEEIEVLSSSGDPFLRIGPDGVSANLNAPDWYLTSTPEGGRPVPDDAAPGASPDWRHITGESVWGWFDHRLHPATLQLPPEAAEAEEPVAFGSWSIPLRHGGRDVLVEGHLEVRPTAGALVSRLRSPGEPVDGLRVQLTQGRVPAVFLDNGTGEVVTVTGRRGEPFLRFSHEGVEANAHSPSFANALRAGGSGLAARIDPAAPPEWLEVASGPRHAWLESRGRYPEERPPPGVVEAGEATVVREWSVPITVGDEALTIEAETRWVPSEEVLAAVGAGETAGEADSTGAATASLVAVAVGVLLLGWWWQRRRDRTGAGARGDPAGGA